MIDILGHLPHLPPSYATAPSKHLTKRELSHLAVCVKCRESVSYSRGVSVQLTTLKTPALPDHLLASIQERLQSGEQFLLPLSENIQRSSSTRWISVAALFLLVLSMWTIWPRQGVEAGPAVGDLQFAGSFTPAQAVDFRYRDHGSFQKEGTLRLRARFRTVDDEEYNYRTSQVVAATMRRKGDVFAGSFVVPSGVVFGAFAVESSDGRRVDSNDGHVWTQLAKSESGAPTFDALTQAFYDMLGASLEEALSIVQQRARLYPESVEGWGELVGYEGFMLGGAHADSTYASRFRTLVAFDEKYKNARDVPHEVADGIAGFAQQLYTEKNSEARPIAKYWSDRAAKYSTKNNSSRTRRLSRFVTIARTNPKAAVDSMDVAWTEGDSVPRFTGNGLNFALEANDSIGVAVWSKRTALTNRTGAGFTYDRLLDNPKFRGIGLDGLRETLRDIYRHDERWRPLDETVSAYARADSAAAGEVLAKIAKGLSLSGRTTASLDTIALATQTGWNPQIFALAGSAYLKAGDTARALQQLARVAVDPTQLDSALALVPTVAGRWASVWNSETITARHEMQRRVLADAISRPISVSPRIANAVGQIRQLEAMANKSVHVVTFWSRYCAPSRRDLGMLDSFAKDLSRHGIPLFPIAQETPSEDLRRYVQKEKITTPIFYDPTREAARAFNQWSTPVYYVVDGHGIIRFADSRMNDVLARAVAVQLASRGQ